MSIETPITKSHEGMQQSGDSLSQTDHLRHELPILMHEQSNSKPPLLAKLPSVFGNFSLSDSASCKADDQPTVTVLNEAQGTIIDKKWCNGDEEFEHADGTKVTFKSDHKGGEISVLTRSDGSHSTSNAHPDGKGGAIVQNTDEANPGNNYTAYYGKDGSLKIDWKDGRHMDRYTDANGVVHTTMTGGNEASDNYTATESHNPEETRVNYTDGSSWLQKADGSVEAHGRYGGLGIMDGIFGSASDFNLTTRWELIGAFWLGQSKAAHDVMNGMAN